MSMTTQCPSCATMFRVTPQQLQSQQGMVRCGRCATVFDGFKALATLADDAPPAVSPSTPAPLPAIEPPPVFAPVEVPVVAAVAAPVEVAVPAAVVVEAPPAAIAAAIESSDVAETVEPVAVEQPVADAVVEPLPAAAPPLEDLPAEAAQTLLPPVAAPQRKNGVWLFGSLVMLVALAAQFVYLYRGDIAAAVPEARPYLNEWCRTLDCTVALPQRPRQITIEASDMQAADSANPGLIILTATLRNQATTTLGYPALDVVLTNTREHTVARRIFLPAEYLAGNKDSRAGFPPSAEITVRLNIDSGDLGAAGFRLDLMAAPAG
jgi:predicted Zn finger-like uncharacterized protein